MGPVDRRPVVGALLVIAALGGAAAGLGSYTFVYAKGYSYLSNDPQACVNCHVMREQFDGWVKGSHHAVATCNSCHMPHGPAKLVAKASNGFWHSYGFTTGRFPDPIRIKPRNVAIVEQNCRSCHAPVVEAMAGAHRGAQALSCLRCHASAGHPGPDF